MSQEGTHCEAIAALLHAVGEVAKDRGGGGVHEKSLRRVLSWTWISRPMMGCNSGGREGIVER